MAATATEPDAPAVPPDVSPVDIDCGLFFGMIEAGLLPPGRRVFLWDGRIYEKMAKTVAHATTSVRLHEALRRRLPEGWLLWPENPLQVDPKHAPLPDLTVVRGPLERFEREHRHPLPEDVGLVVEIAVSRLPKDLGERAEVYARALVPLYWVADVAGRRFIEHAGPQVLQGVGTYARVRTIDHGGDIALTLDGREVARIPIAELLA